MLIKKEDYLKLKINEATTNTYVKYLERQIDCWKNNFNDLEKEKDKEILDLHKRIISLEYELEDVKATAFKMQEKLEGE